MWWDCQTTSSHWIYAAGAAQEKTHFIHGTGVDEHLGFSRDGQSYFYLTDGLGSVAKIVDAGKNAVQSYSYDSYGLPQVTTGFRNSFTFTGREWDGDLGLMYYRARYYDPVEGVFISRDPLGIESGTANLYGYVGQNPGNYTDPSGLIAPAIAVPLYYAGAKMLAAGTAWFGYKAATTSMRASGLVSNKQACDAQKAGNNAMKSVAAINATGAPLAMGPGLATYYGPSLYASGMAWAGTGAGQVLSKYSYDTVEAFMPGPPSPNVPGQIKGVWDASFEFGSYLQSKM